MRKIRLLFLSLSVAALAGCTADMDKFTERLDDLEARVAALETLCAQMNEDISSMRTVISALEDGLYITDVKNVSDGYRIEFSDGETITIRHGRDGEDGTPGADGQDGYTPVIGVRMDADGIYYWTLDGEWLLDDQGNKMRVTGENGKDGADGEDGKDGEDGEDGADGAPGEPGAPGEDGADGKDGVTPVIGVAQDEDGIYYWTINGEWLLDENGNKVQAQGRDGADGQDGKDGADGEDGKDGADGQDGKDGEDGTSLFSSVDVDDDYVTFTLPDGSSFQIPLEKPLGITFALEEEDNVVLNPQEKFVDIAYTVQTSYETVEIEILTSGSITAVLSRTDETTGVIEVTVNEDENGVLENVDGSKVIVLVGDERRVIMRSITFEDFDLIFSETNKITVPAEGGSVDIYYMSNKECYATFLPDWITLPATKAMTDRIITLEVAANDGYPRSADIFVQNIDGWGMYYTIEQDADPEVQKTVEREALQAIYTAYSGDTWADEDRAGWNSDLPLDQWAGVVLDENGYVSGLTLNLPEGAFAMPDEIGNLNSLTELYIDGSTTLSENISGCRMLQSITIQDLYGTIPAELTACSELTYISINGVNAYGEIPANIGNLAKLRVLDISNTGISGSIPASLGNCTELHTLWLRNNNLSGSIPTELTGCPNLTVIKLEYNHLSGSLPESLGQMPALKRLSLYANLLSGAIPQSLQNNVSLWKYCWGYIVAQNDFESESFEVPDWNFEVQDVNGSIINSRTVCAEHEYTVMLNFRMSELEGVADDFSALYDEYGGRLEIIGYSTEDDAQLSQFAADNSIPFPVVAVSEDNPIIAVDEEVLNWFYNLYYPSGLEFGLVVMDNSGDVVYYDLDHALTYSINYLKEFLQSEAGMQYESTDFSQDGTYVTLQSATVGNGIDVVLMGDAYSDRLIADGTYRSVMENTMEQFFSEEPYKSFREYFNVYMVNVVSPNEVYGTDSRTALSTWFGDGTSVGGDDQTVFSYALNAISEDRMDEALIVVMMNRDYYAGTCWMYYPESGDYGNGVSVAYFPTSSDEATFRGLILHEAGGHGFAKLADEYAYEEYGQVPSEEITNCQNLWDFGWYPNIDFTSDPALVNWSEFIADARYQYDGLGVFEGGYTYWTGVWRPTENSIMRYNVGGFNAPSREAIYTRINKLAFGESWQYDYEDFVSYDAVNRRSEPATAPSSALQRHEPTAPPVIVRKTWREALESSGQPEAHLKSR